MPGWKCRILGMLVILVGVCAALPFRGETVSALVDREPGWKLSSENRGRSDLKLQLTVAVDHAAATNNDHSRHIESASDSRSPRQPGQLRQEELQVPPTLATTFEPFPATSPDAPSRRESRPSVVVGPAHLHRIVDGDSLEGLAERFLGSPDNWQFIVQANAILRSNPDILPIGQVLKIPQVSYPRGEASHDHLVPIPREAFKRVASGE